MRYCRCNWCSKRFYENKIIFHEETEKCPICKLSGYIEDISGDEGELWKCQVCGEKTPCVDEFGKCEVQIGWMCNACIEEYKAKGEELEFQDESMEE